MIERIIDFSVRNRLLVLVLGTLAMAAGWYSHEECIERGDHVDVCDSVAYSEQWWVDPPKLKRGDKKGHQGPHLRKEFLEKQHQATKREQAALDADARNPQPPEARKRKPLGFKIRKDPEQEQREAEEKWERIKAEYWAQREIKINLAPVDQDNRCLDAGETRTPRLDREVLEEVEIFVLPFHRAERTERV